MDQILSPLYFCCKEQLPLFLFFAMITSCPFPKVRYDPVLTGAASHLRSFFGAWAKPGWFQGVSCIKLPAVLSWHLFKALVTGRILYPGSSWQGWDLSLRVGSCGINTLFYYSDTSLISVAFSVKYLVVVVLGMDYLPNSWAGSRLVVTDQILWGVKFTAW